MQIKDGGSQKNTTWADPLGFFMRITTECGIYFACHIFIITCISDKHEGKMRRKFHHEDMTSPVMPSTVLRPA